MDGRGRIEIVGAGEIYGAIDPGAAGRRTEMGAERATFETARVDGFGELRGETEAAIAVERGHVHGVQSEDEGRPLELGRGRLLSAGAGERGEGGVAARIHDRARLDRGVFATEEQIDGLDAARAVGGGELGVKARFERQAFGGERVGNGGEAGR